MNSAEIEKRVWAVLATVLKRPFDIGSDVTRKNTREWDSLKHIELMFALEEEFDLQFSEEELASLDDVAKITVAIGARHAA